MAKQLLSSYLKADLYKLSFNLSQNPIAGTLLMSGVRLHKPSRRIMLHQKNLKIKYAKIQTKRKNITYENSVERVNFLPTLEQVRIHTKELIYPGEFQMEIMFFSLLSPSAYKKLAEMDEAQLYNSPLRKYFPLIDEQESREKVKFEISYTE